MKNFNLTLIFCLSQFVSTSQAFNLQLEVKNQPKETIYLAKIEGDKIYPVDSISIESSSNCKGVCSQEATTRTITFTMPSSSLPGMFRLILGKTLVAEVLNEPPQQFDFIFNSEDIILATDFNAPFDSLNVIQSIENKLWYAFLQKEKLFQQKLREFESEINYFQTQKPDYYTEEKKRKYIEQYNQIQKDHNALVEQHVHANPNLFGAKLIKMYYEPFMDGSLSKQQRRDLFKAEYFRTLGFQDEALINSSVYTDKTFKFLMSYAQQRLTKEQQEKEFMNAVDVILLNTNQNAKVYEFILDYLMRGFERLRMDNVTTYIAENYSSTTCQTDEKTTLKRRLESYKMKAGTILPDFTLNDINGDQITLSEILKERNLLLFWASWCPHCNDMLPRLREWQNHHKLENFEIIAISLDTLKNEWRSKVYDLGTESWYNLSDFQGWSGKVTEDYNIYATPTLFLIDKQRQIFAKPLTYDDFVRSLKE